jgi:hypothetical protein
MKPWLTVLAVWLVVLPVWGLAHAGPGTTDTGEGCFFEADFLSKRIAGDTREARAAEARRWYIRRLVRETLAAHRQAAAMTPLPPGVPGS